MLRANEMYMSRGDDGTLVLLAAVLGNRVQVCVGQSFGNRTIFTGKLTTMDRKEFEDSFQIVK